MRIPATTDLRGAVQQLDRIPELVQQEGIRAVIFCGNIVSEDALTRAFHKAQNAGEKPEMASEVLEEMEATALQAYTTFFDEMGKLDVPVMIVPGYLVHNGGSKSRD